MKKSILSLVQDMLSYKKTSITQKNDKGDNSIEHCDIANNMDKSITNNFNITVTSQKQLEEIYESVIRPNSSIYLSEAILPIEALIVQGKLKEVKLLNHKIIIEGTTV